MKWLWRSIHILWANIERCPNTKYTQCDESINNYALIPLCQSHVVTWNCWRHCFSTTLSKCRCITKTKVWLNCFVVNREWRRKKCRKFCSVNVQTVAIGNDRRWCCAFISDAVYLHVVLNSPCRSTSCWGLFGGSADASAASVNRQAVLEITATSRSGGGAVDDEDHTHSMKLQHIQAHWRALAVQ